MELHWSCPTGSYVSSSSSTWLEAAGGERAGGRCGSEGGGGCASFAYRRRCESAVGILIRIHTKGDRQVCTFNFTSIIGRMVKNKFGIICKMQNHPQ